MSTLVGQTVAFLVSLAAFAFLLDGCLRLTAGVRASVASRPCGCSCHEFHFIKREESRNRLDDLQPALCPQSARRLIFEARQLADDSVTLEFGVSRERARY